MTTHLRQMKEAEIIQSARELESGIPGASDVDSLEDAINIIYLHGFADQQAGSTDMGSHFARVDRFAVETDSHGFQRLLTWGTADEAEAALDEIDADCAEIDG